MIPVSSVHMDSGTQANQAHPAAAAAAHPPAAASSLSAASLLGTMRSSSGGVMVNGVREFRVGPQYQTRQEIAAEYAQQWATKSGNPYTAGAFSAARVQQTQQQQQQQQHSPPPDLADVGPLLQLHASMPVSAPIERPGSKAALQRRIGELEDQLRSAHAQNAALIAQLSILKPSVRTFGTQSTDPSHAPPEMGDEPTEEEKQLSPSPIPLASPVEPDTATILAAVESLMTKPVILPRAERTMPPSMQPMRILPSAAAASYALPAVVVTATASVLEEPPRPTLKLQPLHSPVAAAAATAESGDEEDEDLEDNEHDHEEEAEDEEADMHDDGPDPGPEPKPKRAAAKPKAKAASGSGSGGGGAGSGSGSAHKKSALHPFPSTARRASDRFVCPFVNCANSFALCSRRTIKRHVIECAYKDAKVGPMLRAQRFGDEQIEYDAVKHLLLTVKKFPPKDLRGFIFREHKEKRNKHDTPFGNRWYCPNQNRGCDEFFVSTSSTSKAKHLAACPFASRPVTLTNAALDKLRATLKAEADNRAEAYRDRQQQHNLVADADAEAADAEADAMDTGSPAVPAKKLKRKPWVLNSPRRDGFTDEELANSRANSVQAAALPAPALASVPAPAPTTKRRAAVLAAKAQRLAAAHQLESDSEGTDDDGPDYNHQRAENKPTSRAAPAAAAAAAAAPTSAGKAPPSKKARTTAAPAAPLTSADYAALIQQAAQASRKATEPADLA